MNRTKSSRAVHMESESETHEKNNHTLTTKAVKQRENQQMWSSLSFLIHSFVDFVCERSLVYRVSFSETHTHSLRGCTRELQIFFFVSQKLLIAFYLLLQFGVSLTHLHTLVPLSVVFLCNFVCVLDLFKLRLCSLCFLFFICFVVISLVRIVSVCF